MTQFSITILLIPFTQAVKQPLQFWLVDMTITWLITFKLGDLTEQQTASSLSGKIMT